MLDSLREIELSRVNINKIKHRILKKLHLTLEAQSKQDQEQRIRELLELLLNKNEL